MLDGVFKLKKDAALVIDGSAFPAFSGQGKYRNQRSQMCVPNNGPIPIGTYFIVDRPSGGGNIFEQLRKAEWFALFAKDRVIDDERWCAGVLRGQFRLHAKGPLGLSEGCITLERDVDFDFLRRSLLKTERELIPGTKLMSYGTVQVW